APGACALIYAIPPRLSGDRYSAYRVSITRNGEVISGQGRLCVMTAPTEAAPGNPGPGECRAERPLRRDAERNRQRILTAAAEVFTQRGLDATLDDVARQAGVGVGTVYRRVPGQGALGAARCADPVAARVSG